MAEASAESPFIKLRLTAIDTVQLTPAKYPEWSEDSNVPYVFRRSPFFPASVELNRVPEIRIWGATEHGQRCCLHVHGALPYMYLDYKGSLNPEEGQLLSSCWSMRAQCPYSARLHSTTGSFAQSCHVPISEVAQQGRI